MRPKPDMASFTTPGIIVRKTNVGEADRIFTILTQERGKIRALAKSVRKARAKLSPWLDMFAVNDLELTEGKNFYIITGVSTFGEKRLTIDNLSRIGTMYYLCELVDRLIEEGQAMPGLFELMFETMRELKNTEISDLIVKSSFEIKLLTTLGFAPELHHDIRTGLELNPSQPMYFSTRLGGIFQGDVLTADEYADEISVNAIKLLRLLQRYPIAEVAEVQIGEDVVNEVSALLSDFVAHILEVQPKSLGVLHQME